MIRRAKVLALRCAAHAVLAIRAGAGRAKELSRERAGAAHGRGRDQAIVQGCFHGSLRDHYHDFSQSLRAFRQAVFLEASLAVEA